ncbi:MAG TPA: hypothetical protein VKE70_17085, partial [Candidatus Solibacter sp.]|nr:hypothetical protein [Candidatus Solibacter sp.]
MSTARLRLKSPAGWFAAGRETEEALRLLPDGAFRLFLWICLKADRNTGSMPIDPQRFARLLGRTTDDIRRDVGELVRLEVCTMVAERIVVRDRFWPYQRTPAIEADRAFVGAIKRAFLSCECVASVFTAADEKLARGWERKGVPISTIEHAIVLGVARKYTALINNGGGSPITSLDYFIGI